MAKKIVHNDDVSLDIDVSDRSKWSPHALKRLDTILFINEQILQRTNELQIADSARVMYLSVLKSDLSKSKAATNK